MRYRIGCPGGRHPNFPDTGFQSHFLQPRRIHRYHGKSTGTVGQHPVRDEAAFRYNLLLFTGSLLFVRGFGSVLGGLLFARAGRPEALIRFQWLLQMTWGLALLFFGTGFRKWVLEFKRDARVLQKEAP